MRIYTYKFNNYRNRIYKPVYDVTSMLPYRTNGTGWGTSNFNYGDKITTTQIVGSLEQPYMQDSDYCILQQDDGTIMKWFITEAHYVRGFQWQLTLRRDFGDDIFNVDCIIHRGYVPDTSNRIFNSEPLSFNKILKRRSNVTDDSATPWYVAYVSKDFANSDRSISFKARRETVDYEVTSLASWYYYYLSGRHDALISITETLNVENLNERGWGYPISIEGNYKRGLGWQEATGSTLHYLTRRGSWNDIRDAFYNSSTVELVYNRAKEIYDNYGASTLDLVRELNGKIIADSTTKYRIEVKIDDEDSTELGVDADDQMSAAFETLYNNLTSQSLIHYQATDMQYMGYWAKVDARFIHWTMTFQALTDLDEADSITITANRHRTNSSSYDIIAFPAREIAIKDGSNTVYQSSNKADGLAGALASLSQSEVYDIQLIPFSPLDYTVLQYSTETNRGTVVVDDMLNGQDFSSSIGGSATAGYLYIFYVSSATSRRPLRTDLGFGRTEGTILTVKGGFKRAALCDTWRLNSPNMASTFEFNAAEMNGWDRLISVMELKPATPYIQVYPNFERLYGANYNDMRGLICSGEFSLSRTSSEWNEYVLRNKNYQLQFNREIENMSLTQNVERKQQIANAVIGGIASTVQAGVSAGMATANPIAGVAAGAVMAGANVAGAALDIKWSEQLRKEAQNFKQDMFNLSMENIRAVPATLTNVSPINPQNSGFVTFEYYTCSDEEVDTLLNYIRWYGMTVEAVGRVQDWLEPGVETFVSATILRYDGIEDSHYVSALNEELERGFYIRRDI